MRVFSTTNSAAPALVAFSFALLVGGCLSSGGGAAFVSTIGGADGSGCNAEYHSKGCSGATRVECIDPGDGTGATWKKIDVCPSGQMCVEEDVAGAAQPTMKNPVCKDVPKAAVTGGGVTDGGPAKTPAEQYTCMEQKCVAEAAACNADIKCAAAIACVKACTTEACREACPKPDMDAPESALVFAMVACGMTSECIAVCGNDKCEAGENQTTCENDCKPKTTCGDGTCDATETEATCPADCKKATGPVCGNETCEEGETPASCAGDCKAGGPVCGNETCEEGETAASCAVDCKVDVGGPVCGDGKCESPENIETCSQDCKATGPVCGNNKCEAGETKQNCSKDCGIEGPVCGNETCESGESYASCPADCPCTLDSQCGSGKKCSDGQCVASTPTGTCGDLVCASGEKCLMDCDAEAKAGAQCAMSKCSSGWSACKADGQCWGLTMCINACTKGDEACGNACIGKFPGGISKGQALLTCTQEMCAGGTTAQCGDGTCDASETVETCAADCGSSGAGSCVGKCGGQGSAACYCDGECEKFSDCCPDFKTVCP